MVEKRNPILTLVEGHPKELEAIQRHIRGGFLSLDEAAPRFRELIAQNVEWENIFERYGNSPKHIARLLVHIFRDRFISYSDIYRMAVSINMGEGMYSPTRLHPPAPQTEEPSFAQDEVKRLTYIHLATEAEIDQRFKNFMENPSDVLSRLQDMARGETKTIQREIYERVFSHFQKLHNLRIPAFRQEFQPRLYQAEAIAKGIYPHTERTSLAIFDEMRTGKTLMSLARAEYLNSQKALIIVPAGVKRSWYDKIQTYYINPPETILLEGGNREQALARFKDRDIRFAIVNYDLLINRGPNKSSKGKEKASDLTRQLIDIGFDTLIIDEVQYAKNHHLGTKRSDAVLSLTHNPSLRHLMVLSGTPIDDIQDMELIAHLLDPLTYPTPASFWNHSHGRPNPRTGHEELLSKMIRRKAEEVLDLPPNNAGSEQLELVMLTPTQRVLYDFILATENVQLFTKFMNLRAAILQPRLAYGIPAPFDLQTAQRKLAGAYTKWYRQSLHNKNLAFDTDFLVTQGYEDIYIGATFNLEGGISELICQANATLITEAWRGEPVPAKFKKIEELTRKSIGNGEKVIIYTSYFTNGITKGGENYKSEQVHVRSLMAYLQNIFGEDRVLKIDGDDRTDSIIIGPDGVRTSPRELIRKQWTEDQAKDILICNRASSLGIDLSISDPKVTGVTMIFEGMPVSLPDFLQARARVLGDKQKSPIKIIILEALNTLDRDLYDKIKEKEWLSNILLDAAEITPEEFKIFEERNDGDEGYLVRMLKSPRENVSAIFNSMMRQKVEENIKLLAKKFTPSQTYGEYLAQWYDEIYTQGYAKQTIEVVRQIIEGLEKRLTLSGLRIADWGCGPLILSRELGRAIYSLDLSQEMLFVGEQKIQAEGIYIPENYIHQGSLTDMPKEVFKDESINIGVCSLALDCISPVSERLQALREMYRSLTLGGHLILTMPDRELSTKEFYDFQEGLSALGFEDVLSLSGSIKGMSNDSVVYSGWFFVLRKTARREVDIDAEKFKFLFEKMQETGRKKNERRVQKIIKRRSQKMPNVETFLIYIPDKRTPESQWVQKGELSELLEDSLRRYLLDLPTKTLASLGYYKEQTIKNGREEIHLTRT